MANIIQLEKLTLETIRRRESANIGAGRGQDIAAARGYNVERLGGFIFDGRRSRFHSESRETHFDLWSRRDEIEIVIECKSCVHRYPSGGYGRFRIWQQNHHRLLDEHDSPQQEGVKSTIPLYFFVVVEVKNKYYDRELGKLAVRAERVESAISSWREASSRGGKQVRDLSWRLLFDRLGVSVEEFREQDIVDLTS